MSKSQLGYSLKKLINSPILFNNYKVSTFENGFSFTYIDCGDLAVFVCIDVIFHLHSFKDNDGLPLFYGITHIYLDIKDYPPATEI